MDIRYDPEVDALRITFRDTTTVTTEELAEGFVAEYDTEGHVVGLEILDAGRRMGDLATLRRIGMTLMTDQ